MDTDECALLLKKQGDKELIELKVISPGSRFREDMALLRALAILGVLGYHFWPQSFPLGFLGVDIFFVISGFLIMRILTNSNERLPRKILSFYFKRVKRICPLYYLIVFGIGLCIPVAYSLIWSKKYFTYYKMAILFNLNIVLLASDGNYFAEETSDLPFLHTWSLAVEMQFYLVAPLLFSISTITYKRLGPVFLLSILVSSLHFQILSTPITAFYHPIARIWQFLVGMIASHFAHPLDNDKHERFFDIASMFSLLLVLTLFSPLRQGEVMYFRIIITLVSGLFAYFSTYSSIDWGRLRMGYLAKISYSLYLVHYPVLKIAEYQAQFHALSISASWISLGVTMILGMILHHLYERPMLNQSKSLNLKNICLFLGLSLLISHQWPILVQPETERLAFHDQSRTPITTREEAFAAQSRYLGGSVYKLEGGENVHDVIWRELPQSYKKTFGHYVYPRGTGNISVLIVGNSWSTQQAYIVRKLLPPNITSTIELIGIPNYCLALDGEYPRTKESSRFFFNLLNTTKPTFLFILLRYLESNGEYTPFNPVKDAVLERYLRKIDLISRSVQHIFIEGEHPFRGRRHSFSTFLDHLQKNRDLSKFNLPYNETILETSPVRQRLKIVLEKCKKCSLIKIDEAFIDRANGLVRTYDPHLLLSYLDNEFHLTPHGLKMIEPSFQQAIQPVLSKILPLV